VVVIFFAMRMMDHGLKKQSLHQLFPGSWHLPVLVVVSLALLVCALVLPVMRVEKLVFWQDNYSVITGVKELYFDGSWALATVLFLFSVLFPIGKLMLLLGLWYRQVDIRQREKLLHLLGHLSRWSMLDVFVVALMIVLSKGSGLLDIEPRIGVYLFGVAVIASTFLAESVKGKHKESMEGDAA